MDVRSLTYIAGACDGELIRGEGNRTVSRVCLDSRQAQAGDVFFALKGDRFDGHDYIGEVARKGVDAVVMARTRLPVEAAGSAVIAVDDPRKALGRLAARYRSEFGLPMIAVGGSNGKTSTKELVASVLSGKLRTLRSEASFNNDIGVPVTLLRLDRTYQAAVLEAGTNHPGELAPLIGMIQPRYGIITSIGREHLEFFVDAAGVASEEGWLAEMLPADGTLWINGDCEWTGAVARRAKAKVVRVGLEPGNDWRASDVRLGAAGTSFTVRSPEQRFDGDYVVGLLGRHQAVNALFALAAGAELGLTPGEARAGLATSKPARMRLEPSVWNGVCVLNDAYNANADSMIAALETLREMPCDGRRVAVLGEMAELGAESEAAHREVGAQAAQVGLDQLVTVGDTARLIGQAARAAGLTGVQEFADIPTAAAAVKSYLRPGDAVLLKASRAAKLERLLELLREPGSAPA
jgi:UDP-N-acetylmuramoyl-tripeptide--D-alanyl-D-alanine ligase